MFCSEFILDDAIAITAIPVSDYSLGFSQWQLTPTIPRDELDPPLNNAITIGIQPAAKGRPVIPILRRTGKAKDEENDSVADRIHFVNVTCEIDARDASVWNNLLALERTPSHLLLTSRDGTKAFVLATKDTYVCTTERDGGKTSVSFKIQNIMGVQPVI